MAIIRKNSWIGQQRVDLSHLRSIESAVSADFDLAAGKVLAGGSSFIVKGFDISVLGVGGPASSLQLATANGVVVHPLATESGTLFFTPADRAVEVLSSTNARVTGSFTAAQTNFVGIDLRRSADDSTSDIVQFLDTTTGSEIPEEVPLARTLDYKIIISTTDFSSTPAIAPIAKIITNVTNNVTSIVDCRDLLFRLGSGGSVPNTQFAYSWPAGREENLTGSVFSGGDKAIGSQKEWQNAIMSRLWELGGGKYWYSPTADRNVQLIRKMPTPFPAAPPFGGDWFEFVAFNLHWANLTLVFDNSGGAIRFNDIADQTINSVGLTDVLDGECIYVDIDRFNNRTGVTALSAKKAAMATLGYPAIPGTRYVLAYRVGATVFSRGAVFPLGMTTSAASVVAYGVVELTHADASGTAGGPRVLSNSARTLPLGVVPTNATLQATVTSTAGTALIVTTLAANTSAIDATGTDTAPGITTTSGAGGRGILAIGGAGGDGGRFIAGTDARGASFVGDGAGAGLFSRGGDTGKGGTFVGGLTSGEGIEVIGGATSSNGGTFTGGNPSGRGISATGVGAGEGLRSTGGTTSGVGARIIGGAPNGTGVVGEGTGTGVGGSFAPGVTEPNNAAVVAGGNIRLSGTVPSALAGFGQFLTPRNLIRAWCRASINFVGVITIIDGYNIGLPFDFPFPLVGRFTFATPLTTSAYVVIGVAEGNDPAVPSGKENLFFYAEAQSPTGFLFRISRATIEVLAVGARLGQTNMPLTALGAAAPLEFEFIVVGV